MDTAISEAHSDSLVELTTLIRSTKRQINTLMNDAVAIVSKIDKFQSKREVQRELRRRYIEALDKQQAAERRSYFLKMQEFHYKNVSGASEGGVSNDVGTFINSEEVRSMVVQVNEI